MLNNFLNTLSKYKKYLPIAIILISSIFVCIPLLITNIDISGDDGIQHICRLIGTESSIKEGGLFFPIMSEYANNFGYSWNIFYSPLTAYTPLLFRILGFSFTDCIKIFMFIVVFLSGITMYMCTIKITKNKKIATIAAIVYIFAPYRFTDMYMRNALAELTSFIFIPLVFMGLYSILNKKKDNYMLVIGAVGLILTHLIVTMYTMIFAIIYLIVNLKKLKDIKVIKKIVINILLILVITSFFWMPLLEHKLKANYEVFKDGRMERTEVLIAYKLELKDLFSTDFYKGMIYEIGLLSVISLILTPITIKILRKNKEKSLIYKNYIFFLVMGIISLIMTLKIFPFEYMPSILKMIQFTFRLLEFSAFFLSFIVAISIDMIMPIKFKNLEVLIVLFILMTVSLFYMGHLRFLAEPFDESRLWPPIKVTSNTGRVHAGLASFEYLPCKAFENRSYLEKRSQDAIVLEGKANILNENKNNSNMSFEVENLEEKTIIELPYIYYLGYEANLYVDDTKIKLETSESENGFLQIEINENVQRGKIQITYEGTLIMKSSKIISILGIGILVILIFFKQYKNKEKKS